MRGILNFKTKLMKKLFVILAISATSLAANAQDITGFNVEGGINLAIPANNFSGASIGAGVDVLGQYGVAKAVGITGDAGYTAIFPKGGGSSLGIIPIRVGVRYYPSPSFYLGAKGGVGFLTGGGSSITATAYSFGAGYYISPALDLGASYDGYSKNGSFGIANIRLGYTFGK